MAEDAVNKVLQMFDNVNLKDEQKKMLDLLLKNERTVLQCCLQAVENLCLTRCLSL